MASANKKILFISQSFYPATGGVSALLLNLIQEISKHGYEFSALHLQVPRGSSKSRKIRRVKEYSVPLSKFSKNTLQEYAIFKEHIYKHLHGLRDFEFKQVRAVPGRSSYQGVLQIFEQELKKIIAKERPELIHLHDYQLLPLTDKTTVPIVISLHAPLLESLNSRVYQWMEPYLLSAKKVIVSTPQYRRTLIGRGFPRTKIMVIPPVTSPSTWSEFQSKRPINKSVEVTAIQRFDAKSGYPQLIAAFEQLLKSEKSIHLNLVGNGSLTSKISNVRKNYKAQIQKSLQSSLVSKVSFLGDVDYLSLGKVYLKTDIFCMLSQMECFGMALAEATAFGIPVVASKVGGPAYQVAHGKTGYLVQVGDINGTARFLQKLVQNPSLRKKIGRQAKSRYDKLFSPRVLVKKYLKLYQGEV